LTERSGVAVVMLAVQDGLRWLFRELTTSDVGIDGHIEVREDGEVHNALLGVQIKSGASAFAEEAEDGWVYRPRKPDNVEYWLNSSMPVLLLLVDTDSRRVFWQHVNRRTVVRTGKGWKVLVPRSQELGRSARAALLACLRTEPIRSSGDLVPARWGLPFRIATAEEVADERWAADRPDDALVANLTRELVAVGLSDVQVLRDVPLCGYAVRIPALLAGSDPATNTPRFLLVRPDANTVLRPSALGTNMVLDDRGALVLPPLDRAEHYVEVLRRELTLFAANPHWISGVACTPRGLAVEDRLGRRMLSLPADIRSYLRETLDDRDAQTASDLFLGSGERAPSEFVDEVHATIKAGDGFIPIDEQEVARRVVVNAVDRAERTGERLVVVVTGGPGTGKSMLALGLTGEAARRGWHVRHATGSSAFTNTLRKATGRRDHAMSSLFRYFNNFIDTAPQSLDLLVCDEAHRIRASSVNRYTPRAVAEGARPQVAELVDAAKVVAFFLDEAQTVRPGEVGSVEHIRETAHQAGVVVERVHLDLQLRHRGGRAYVRWLDDLLSATWTSAPWPWSSELGYRLMVAETPEEMEEFLRTRHGEGHRTRITAGYCWPWSDPVESNGVRVLVPDVRIGDWAKPWNAKPGMRVPNAPEAWHWAVDSRGYGQVGSIYTAQGFEFSWGGVIIGPDLVRRGDTWVVNLAASHDPAVRRAADEAVAKRLVLNTYRVLMTRGRTGTVVYSVDAETRAFVRGMVEHRMGHQNSA
jgi:hypothetical protein